MSLSENNLITSAKHYLNQGYSVEKISVKLGVTYTHAVTLTSFAVQEAKEEKKASNTLALSQITKLENDAYRLALEIGGGNDGIKKRKQLANMLVELEKVNY